MNLALKPGLRQPSRSDFVRIRGVDYHVRRWGKETAPALFLLHGWRDTSASFQFAVDAFANEWNVIAPDWTGFGKTGLRTGIYNYVDYQADLDALLDHYSPGEPVQVAAHSMAANALSLFAGVRPQRIARYALLDGLGPTPPMDEATELKRLRKWLDGAKHPTPVRQYRDETEFVQRLQDSNPRLTPERAAFLAAANTHRSAGGIAFDSDPANQLYIGQIRVPLELFRECWRNYEGEVLFVAGLDSPLFKVYRQNEAFAAIYRDNLAAIAKLRTAFIEDAGHNLHHDQPEKLAALLEDFFVHRPSAPAA